MQDNTTTIIRAAVAADPTIESGRRQALLSALNTYDPSSTKMINRRQAAEILSCSRDTVRRMGERGVLHPVELSPRIIRYALCEVRRLATKGISQNVTDASGGAQ